MTIVRQKLDGFFTEMLKPDEFSDYGPNGLQIEGSEMISRIAFAVSATADSAEKAVAGGAQALVVHHGLFWKFHGARPLAGPFAKRIFPLVRNGVNLFGYHLPLDGHPEIGNAAVLGRKLGIERQAPFGDYKGSPVGIQGNLLEPVSARALKERLRAVLDHDVALATPDEAALIKTAGIITGGANSEWSEALRNGLDAYITGEMSEHDWHESQEAGVHMYAGGHHATERFGIQALMEKVRERFDVACFYIPSENPA